MQIEYDKFNAIVKAMVDKLDAKHTHVKTITSGGTPTQFHLGYALASDALESALNEHGFTVENTEFPSNDEVIDQMTAEIEAELKEQAARTFRISHHYDKGNQEVFIERRTGDVDAKRAAIYCQFMCEEWFGKSAVLTNLGVAAMLVMFYGFRHTPFVPANGRTEIDMYRDREAACGDLYFELMADESLRRDGMRECMPAFID